MPRFIDQSFRVIGFKVEKMPHGNVSNFYARKGQDAPLLVFAGHTDVVPPGPEEKWSSPPFKPTIKNDRSLWAWSS